MSNTVKFTALLLGSTLLMFGGGLQGLVLYVRGAEEGFSLLSLGLIGTGWSVGFIAGSLAVPNMVRQVGHIRAYSVMAAVATITILLNLLWINDVAWIVLRILSGFCFAGAAMVVESWLNEFSDNQSRGTVFSVYTAVTLAASTAGQFAMSITGVAGYLPFVVGAIALAGAVLPTALTRSQQPLPLNATKLDIGLLYRTSPVAVVASFGLGIANGAFGTLAPVYSIGRGVDPASIAYLMSLAIVAGAIAQIPLGRLSDRVDRRLVMIGVCLFAAVTGALFVVTDPGGGVLAYILFAAYGLAAYPLYAITIAHANDFAREGEFGKIASGMLVVMGVGLAIGPIIGAFAMNAFMPSGLFAVTAIFHLGIALFAVIRMQVRSVPEEEERAPFHFMLVKTGTPETVALDPRAEEDLPPEPKPE